MFILMEIGLGICILVAKIVLKIERPNSFSKRQKTQSIVNVTKESRDGEGHGTKSTTEPKF